MAAARAEVSVTAVQAAAFRLARQHLARRPADPSKPSATVAAPRNRSADAFAPRHRSPDAAARPGRNRSAEPSAPPPGDPPDIVDVVRDTGGIQAQVMSAAELAIWTRRRETTRDDVRRALWESRTIVRTSALRLTLHLIAARDLPIYIAAVKSIGFKRLQYWLGRLGATPAQIRRFVDSIVGSLEDGRPRTQQELIAEARKKVGAGMRRWLDAVAIGIRPAVLEGLVVYGPPRGAESTFVRTDTWLGPQPPIDVDDARAELVRRFLRAFGPATPHDFAKWSGLTSREAKPLFESPGRALAPVLVDGALSWVLSEDVAPLSNAVPESDEVTLLGAFDAFLLAHATKAHLVDRRFYARVYRPQGWISPVVLRGGVIAGVWFPEIAGTVTTLRVELFARATPTLRLAIAREAEALGRFLGTACAVRIK